MGKNNGRVGEVKRRFQVYNPKNKRWVKSDAGSGKFMDQKATKKLPFKGVRKHK